MCKEEIVLGFPFICIYRQKKREAPYGIELDSRAAASPRQGAANVSWHSWSTWTVEVFFLVVFLLSRLRSISKMVPGKSMRDCIARAKYLSEKFSESAAENTKRISLSLGPWTTPKETLWIRVISFFFSMSLGCDFLYYVEEESVEVTNEESGDDSKKTPTEIIEPYLSSMDESVKEYSESTSSCQK